MNNLKKSWKTTLIGLIIAFGLAYKGYMDGFTITEAIAGLISIGFIFAKDSDKSHSK